PSVDIVVDGHSKDDTVREAIKRDADVVYQKGIGYGDALQTGFRHALEKYGVPVMVMMDADGTYDARDLERVIEPILRGNADFVIGNRLGSMDIGAMNQINRIGNRVISKFVSLLIGVEVRDTQCGLRAFSRALASEFVNGHHGMPFAAEMVLR